MFAPQGLYDPGNEHDACGVGFVVNINGEKEHRIIEQGITVLQNLLHRGALGADANTGDGAGLLFQIPDRFFRKACEKLKIRLPDPGTYAVGMLFLPQDRIFQELCRRLVEKAVSDGDLGFLGWREVPVNGKVLGEQARQEMPVIMQCFVDGKTHSGDALEQKLYLIRKAVEKEPDNLEFQKVLDEVLQLQR